MSHVWMSHVTHTNESGHRHMSKSYRTCVNMSHTMASPPTYGAISIMYIASPCMYKLVMSHVWTSHVTQMNESCHTYEWVMSHIQMSLVTNIWAISHIQMSLIINIRVSHVARAYTRATTWLPRLYMAPFLSCILHRPVTPMNESCHTQVRELCHRCVHIRRHHYHAYMKRHTYEASHIWSVTHMKCHTYEVSHIWSVTHMKCHTYEVSHTCSVTHMKCHTYISVNRVMSHAHLSRLSVSQVMSHKFLSHNI